MIRKRQNTHPQTSIQTLNTFAVPLIIQFVANYVIGLTDQAIIGRISVEAYGVIGVINSFNYMVLGIVGAVSIIFNMRAGSALGQGDEKGFRDEFMTSILLGWGIGALLWVGTVLSKTFILKNIYGFHGVTLSTGLVFFTVVSPYGLLQLLIFIFGQYFKVKHNTRWLLLGSFLSSVVNLVLDFLFVLGGLGFPKLGAAGAAASTVFAMLLNLLLLVSKSRQDIHFDTRKFLRYCTLAKQHLLESVPLMGQELLEGSVFVIALNAIITRIGIIELSVYLILQQLLRFLFVPMNMYSSATLTLVSQNKGNSERLREYPKVSCFLSMSLYGCMAVAFFLLRDWIPKIITNDIHAIHGSAALLLLALLTNCMTPLSTIYKNALTAVGESKFVLYQTALVNMMVIIIAIVLTHVLGMGLRGILLCSLFNGSALFAIYYRKYKRKVSCL